MSFPQAANMNSVLTSVQSLMQMFDGKAKEFTDEIENVHMVWLEEIQQEANRMFSRDFNAEPELMPKTPSQKKNSRRKRLSSGHQEANPARFSKGKRSNLRGSIVKSLNLITEEEIIPEASTSQTDTTWQPKRTTRKNNNKLQTQSEVAEDVSLKPEEVQNKKPELVEVEENNIVDNVEDKPDYICGDAQSPPAVPSPEVVVSISASDRLSAELVKDVQLSLGRSAAKIAIAGAALSSRRSSRRSSVHCSLKVRHSLAGLRHSMTQESLRRASRRSMLKRQVSRMGNSICSSNIDEHSSVDSVEEMEAMPEAVSADENAAAEECIETLERQIIGRITRSVAANSAAALSPVTSELSVFTPKKKTAAEKKLMAVRMSRLSQKRKAQDTSEETPTKHSLPKKSASAMRPNMKSFLHTVQKNQLLMMTPNSLGRSAVFKSFIKQNTPLKVDPKLSSRIVTKERYKLEALQKKREQEEERMKKMEEEKKKRNDELKRRRDERLKKVLEAKGKEEQREMEKKKKIEQKMIQIDEKNDKRQAEENKKKKLAVKRQEDLEQRKKQEEEAKKKIQQAEEEKKQQELLAKKKAEEEEQRTLKLAEARQALELKREQERDRLAAAEREREEKEKALVLQRELERAAREKERKELQEKRKALEENGRLEEQQLRLAAVEVAAKEREAAAKKAAEAQKATASLNLTVDIQSSVLTTPVGKGAGFNVTIDLEKSPQSYSLTPKGRNKPTTSKTAEDYGMDQNSDDSTDDESAPRKPIPSWAEGHMLQQIIVKQYYNPPNFENNLGIIEPPKLETIFNKNKPRYMKRTSSAVWHSPPNGRK
ncbi:inner centromere protein B isoform X2 [Trematomus bernacchii]|uniref:inner centromere protein B isoform X2 n=1 Tax=Trematomus bernacchii TaxID=40690 RepID=UPI00146E5582|nr:inner centromere protein B isoform X2 [Trematomus bernacchii]